MKNKFFALAAIAVLLLNVVGMAAGDTRRDMANKRQASRLVSLLPASDAVVVFDTKRFIDDALPKLLSANQPMLNEITKAITEMETKAGIDIRKFEQIAAGVSMKQVTAKNPDFEPIVLMSGDINAGGLISIAKIASDGKYREEKVGEHPVYIFTMKDAVQDMAAKTKNSQIAGTIDMGMKGLSQEVAVTSLDQNTMAFGSFDKVRETIEAKSHIDADLANLLLAKEAAVMSFAVKVPAGMAKSLKLDNDELGKNLDSIRYLSGSFDVAAAGATMQMLIRTEKPEEALGLKNMLEGLQMLGNAILGNSKKADQQIYGRMVKNLKFDVLANDVTLEMLVPQADIDTLIAGAKKTILTSKPPVKSRKHRTTRKHK